MKKILIIICTSVLIFSGCSIHKLEVQQGNIITPDVLEKIEVGMDQERVRFMLGTPPLMDPFHQDRWDYTYTYREKDLEPVKSHVIIWFDERGAVTKIDKSGYVPPKQVGSSENY